MAEVDSGRGGGAGKAGGRHWNLQRAHLGVYPHEEEREREREREKEREICV